MNCLSCRNPYQIPHSLICPPPFSLKSPFFFTEKCFVASPSQKSAQIQFNVKGVFLRPQRWPGLKNPLHGFCSFPSKELAWHKSLTCFHASFFPFLPPLLATPLSTKSGKELPSRNLREKRSDCDFLTEVKNRSYLLGPKNIVPSPKTLVIFLCDGKLLVIAILEGKSVPTAVCLQRGRLRQKIAVI